MRLLFATTCISTVALLAAGCATKKYVRNTAAPIQAKVDQVGEQTTQNGQSIEDTRTQVKQVDEKAQSGINAAQERASTADQHAMTADQHAGDAANRANQAQKASDDNGRELAGLRQVVSNIDDYKLQTSVTVPFRFDKYTLTKDAKQDLDKLADDMKADKRYFIAVEGYTDKIGNEEYNENLSRRRADSVVEYLVAQHDIPIFRIHMVGLGQMKPVEDARSRAANAKNRRVEVTLFSADQSVASNGPGGQAPAGNANQR
jgi:OOP family OmpA-OmpF porin